MKVRSIILEITSPYKYRFVYLALALIAVVMTFINLWYLVVLLPYGIYIMCHHKDLLRPIIILIMLFFSVKYTIDYQQIDTTAAQTKLKVIESFNRGDYYELVGRKGIVLVKMYLTDGEEIKVGSYYEFSGEWKTPPSQTIPFGFDYKNYLLSKRIKYILYVDESEFHHRSASLSQLRQITFNYIEHTMPMSKDYIKTFLLADKSDIDQHVMDGVNFVGISHMFAVSGYHIGLLVLALTTLGKKSHIKVQYVQYGIAFVLIVYMVLTAFSPSVVRASLLYILLFINKKWDIQLSVVDVLSIIFLGCLICNPYSYYNIGFVLSFYITFVLLLSNRILHGKSTFHTLCLVSCISFFASLPVVINMNYHINMLTLVWNVVVLYLMSFVILPVSYITFFVPILDPISSTIFSLFDGVILVLSGVNIGIIDGFFDHPIWIILFLSLLFGFLHSLERQKISYYTAVTGLAVFLVATNLELIRPTQRIVFVDVEGDAIVLMDTHDQCNIVIDTGEDDPYDGLVHYLKSQHIKRIDYFIISHFHSDHFGEGEDIVKAFDVEHVVSNQRVSSYENKQISCGNLALFIYPLTYGNQNENNNSVVVSVWMAGKHFLFMGDSEVERETDLLDIEFAKVDYLKLGHHGSITSSSELFINHVSPQNAIITVYRDNRNNHPNDVVLSRFNERNIPLFRTDHLGTIEIIYHGGKEQKKYYSP